MNFKHAYSESCRSSDLECLDPSLAQQNFKDEVDINVLLERFKVTGQLPQNVVLPTYGDFVGINDYRTAREAILRAEHSFMDLPANVRARFQNDPQRFLEFCSDEKNLPELQALGLTNLIDKPAVGGMGGSAPHGDPGTSASSASSSAAAS